MNPERTQAEVVVPVSAGEVVDKITILQIKSERIKDEAKLSNVRDELDELTAAFDEHFPELPEGVGEATDALRGINVELWEIEDKIRDCERRKDFGSGFVALARSVYLTNDRRAEVKREID